MGITKTLKRMMALFLVTVLVCTTIRTTSGAGDLINLNPYRQVFRGKDLNAFGKTHRDMNIYQVGEGAGALPALCIQEGHKLPDGSPAKYEQYNVEHLSVICLWCLPMSGWSQTTTIFRPAMGWFRSITGDV